ncbi:hypothetical protein [Sphingopyxis macrogoltabida]|uniref:Uncharacterized protein n=1 Tax=Sphingopyxis macrogoltabida TaxID=33050 RepID=A0A0N9UDZ3_SPHMC|nr:hypothetical protein [Sphingopyxis macrogoltabida]ALH81602.1 hypothetical protein AN936_14955 [Sphingopyxis macrogoltabida]
MSFDYFIAVQRNSWPTGEAVQTALGKLGYPLRLVDAPSTPFAVENFRDGLPVIFEGRKVILEADTEEAQDADDSESLFGYIAECAAPNFSIVNGDRFLTLTFRADADQIRAGLYLAAAMIKSFGGYGFENQFETHGSLGFADQLLAEASDAPAFEREEPRPPESISAIVQPEKSRGFFSAFFGKKD